MQRFAVLLAFLTGSIAASASADVLSLDDVSVGAPGSANSVGVHYFSLASADTVSVLVDAPSWYHPDYISTHAYLFTASGAVIGSAVGLLNGNASIVAQLAAGTYVVAVGDFPLTPEEAWTGVNEPDAWEQLGIAANDGKYDLTIKSKSADLAWASAPAGGGGGTGVPELSANDSMAALVLLLGGVALTGGRRRRTANV